MHSALEEDLKDYARSQDLSPAQTALKRHLLERCRAAAVDALFTRRQKLLGALVLLEHGVERFASLLFGDSLAGVRTALRAPQPQRMAAVMDYLPHAAAARILRAATDAGLPNVPQPPQVHVFGSSGNGFGGPGSDIDVAIEVHPPLLRSFSQDFSGKQKRSKLGPQPLALRLVERELMAMAEPRGAHAAASSAGPRAPAHGAGAASGAEGGSWRSGAGAGDWGRGGAGGGAGARGSAPAAYGPVWTGIQAVLHARVPLLKITHSSGANVDLSVNNLNGVRNTVLLRTYVETDDRVRPLVLAVKRWAKAHGLADASAGFFSSYSLTLLALYFLQHVAGILPSLQDPEVRALPVQVRLSSSSAGRGDVAWGWGLSGVALPSPIHSASAVTLCALYPSSLSCDLTPSHPSPTPAPSSRPSRPPCSCWRLSSPRGLPLATRAPARLSALMTRQRAASQALGRRPSPLTSLTPL
jgi:hypothetical protein